jgi:hypothetical protein
VFTPSVAVGVSFDDNPVLATRGNPSPDDVVGVVRPSGQLEFNQKHTHVGLGYYGTLMRYREFDQFDNYGQRAMFEFRHQPTRRLRLFGRNSFTDTPATDEIQVAGVPFFRTGTRHDEAEAGFAIRATRRLEITSAYHYQWVEFEQQPTSAERLLQGGSAHGVTVDARQQLSNHWRVGGSWEYRHSRLTDGVGAFDIQNVQGLVEWQATPTVVVEGGAGISYLTLPAPLGSETGPAGHVSVRKRTEYAYFTFNAMRSFVPAFAFGGSLRNQEISASVRVPFARRRAYVQGTTALRDSEPVLARELGVRAFWVDANVGYLLQRWLRVEAFYTGAFQDTDVAGGQVDRNRVGVQFITSRPVRFE